MGLFSGIVGLLGAGLGAANSAGLFGGGGSLQPRNLAREAQDTVNSRLQFDPTLFGLNYADALRQSGLNSDAVYRSLFGGPATTSSYQANEQVAAHDILTPDGQSLPPKPAGATPIIGRTTHGLAQIGWHIPAHTGETTRTEAIPAARGLLSVLGEAQPQLDQLQTDSQGRLTAAGIQRLQTYGPGFVSAEQAANPQRTALLNDLNGKVQEQLDAGTQMDPSMAREFQQQVRQAQAARGMGYGPADAYQEAATLGQAGQALRQQRQASAQSFLGLRAALDPNPDQYILGIPGNTGLSNSIASQAYGVTTQQQPGLWTPYGADAANTNANAQLANTISQRNNIAGISSGLLGLGGNIYRGNAGSSGGYGIAGINSNPSPSAYGFNYGTGIEPY